MTPEEHYLNAANGGNLDGRIIGGPGYTLPSLSVLQRYDLDEIANGAADGISVKGRAGSGNAVYLPKTGLRKPISIAVSAKTQNCLFVFDEDLMMSPQIKAVSHSQAVILSGGVSPVSNAGKVNVSLFASGQTFFWGRGATSNGLGISVVGEDRSVVVGDDCMFAGGVNLRTHDMHAIFDMDSGEQTNFPADILLEPHVWVGQHAYIARGVTVGLGSIVGTRSVVTRSVPRFSAVGGIPAKVIKSRTSWDRLGTVDLDTIARLRDWSREIPDRTSK